MSDGFYVYTGTLPCGCKPAACVDEPQYADSTAKSIADMVRGGMTVNREYVPEGGSVGVSRCTCEPVEETLTLLPGFGKAA